MEIPFEYATLNLSFTMKMRNNLQQRIVVKVGTSTLTDSRGGIDRGYIKDLTGQIARQAKSGGHCVLVTSGAIRAGRERLNLKARPKTIPEQQAAAAVGQGLLMNTYTEAFREAGFTAAQVLLTRDDFKDRTRYLNARNTLNTLLRYNCVPIINENDTVAIDEIKFGDNDTLAAFVASTINANMLIILSDVPGLYDRDPTLPDCQLVPVVPEITPEIQTAAGGTHGDSGTGGMRTKIEAAQIATTSGIDMVIADGRRPNVIDEICAGENVGTRFLACAKCLSSRKRWIAFSTPVRGSISVNEGAVEMLVKNGKSLLAAGIVDITGNFKPGDLVAVIDQKKQRFARGFANYSASDIRKIMGAKTSEIEKILGHKDFDEVIHRDNLVIGV